MTSRVPRDCIEEDNNVSVPVSELNKKRKKKKKKTKSKPMIEQQPSAQSEQLAQKLEEKIQQLSERRKTGGLGRVKQQGANRIDLSDSKLNQIRSLFQKSSASEKELTCMELSKRLGSDVGNVLYSLMGEGSSQPK